MLEVTRVKVDGAGELVVHGETLFVRRGENSVTCPLPTSGAFTAPPTADSSLALRAVDGLLTVIRALLRLFVGMLCALCSELVVPVLREVGCAVGAIALYLTGAGLQCAAASLLQGSAQLYSHSRLLRAGSGLLNSRTRSDALSTVDK